MSNQNLKLILQPISPGRYAFISQWFDVSSMFNLTISLGFVEEGNIYTLKQTLKRDPFKFLVGFDIYIWIALLITIFCIPLFMAFIEKSLSNYWRNFWNYAYFILSESIPQIPNNLRKRCVLLFYLLSCTILLAAYAGVIKDIFLMPAPEAVVNSWEDLYNRKDLKIWTFEGSVIHNFVKQRGSSHKMSRDFSTRIEIKGIQTYDPIRNIVEAFNKLLSGSYAVSYEEYIMDECEYWRSFNFKPEECDKVYKSKEDIVTAPYFLFKSTNLKTNIFIAFDKM